MDPKIANAVMAQAAASHREIELKLRVRPEAFGRLREAPCLARSVAGAATHRTLDAAYYDTADFRLHRRGLSFRVRREGDRFIQTVKVRGDGAGVLRRDEWNTQVPALAPHPDWITEPEARARLGYVRADELDEVFRTVVERETRVVSFEDAEGHSAVVEVAFDTGRIETPERSFPIAEVELELLKGTPSVLYSLARQFHEYAPVHVETRSKPERAYALATREAPAWTKAGKLRFDEGVSVHTAIATVFQECFAHWLANEPAAHDGTDPEGVHQVRVALRRLRSALSIFSDVIPDDQLAWLKGETKWLAGALGPARDWDVYLDELMDPLQSARTDDAGLTVLRQRCEAARRDGYRGVREAVESRRYTAFVLRFGEWLEQAGWRANEDAAQLARLNEPLQALADSLLTRQHEKVAKLGRGLRSATPEARHRLRLAVKKLRYSADFFASLYGRKKVRPYLRRLAALQNTLGRLNDVAETESRLDTVVGLDVLPPQRDDLLKAVGMAVGWSAESASRAEPELLDDWKAFRKRKVFWTPARKRTPHPALPAEAASAPLEPAAPTAAPQAHAVPPEHPAIAAPPRPTDAPRAEPEVGLARTAPSEPGFGDPLLPRSAASPGSLATVYRREESARLLRSLRVHEEKQDDD